jgi:putative membrane protein
MMGGWGNGMGGWGGALWIVLLLVLLALIGVGIVLLVRGLSGRDHTKEAGVSPGTSSGAAGSKSALQTLEDRYARGEIDREEFLQRKADLGS